MPWTNADGLVVYFPGDNRISNGGEYPGAGETRVIEVEFDVANLGTAATLLNSGYQSVIMPRNSRIDSVEVVAETAFTGLTAVDFGFFRLDQTTEYDHDGLVALLPIANLNVSGEKNVLTAGVTYAGTLVGTTTAYPCLFSGRRTGSAGTGRGVLRVKIYVPSTDANPGQV